MHASFLVSFHQLCMASQVFRAMFGSQSSFSEAVALHASKLASSPDDLYRLEVSELHLKWRLHRLSPGKPCLGRPCRTSAYGDAHLSIYPYVAALVYSRAMSPCCFAADFIYTCLRSAAADSYGESAYGG